LQLGEYIAALEIKFDLNLTFLKIFQMVLSMCFLAHMLGCFWFYVAAWQGLDPDIVTWVQAYDDGRGLEVGPGTQYLLAVYWALTTLTTVGYGDITPANDAERMYALFALLTGALVFGFMLSSIGSLVAAVDRQAALSEERMDEVKEYMRWRKLPRDLVMRLRRYYTCAAAPGRLETLPEGFLFFSCAASADPLTASLWTSLLAGTTTPGRRPSTRPPSSARSRRRCASRSSTTRCGRPSAASRSSPRRSTRSSRWRCAPSSLLFLDRRPRAIWRLLWRSGSCFGSL